MNWLNPSLGSVKHKSLLPLTDLCDAVPRATMLYTDVDGQCDKLWWWQSPVYHTDCPSQLTAPKMIRDMVGAHQNLNSSRDPT